MNILVINCHSDNRGDEAAIHAMVDELNRTFGNIKITLSIRGVGTKYPNMPSNVTMIHQFNPISKKTNIAHQVALITCGKVVLSKTQKDLVHEIDKADLILHAPGGPSIGDTYYDDEPTYLKIFDLIRAMNKPYMFYAPSMGPFIRKERNKWRKLVLSNSEAVVLRDPISVGYVRAFIKDKNIIQALDSALQNDISINENQKKLEKYIELDNFIFKYKKCVGITITDLLWHPVYSQQLNLEAHIKDTFQNFVGMLIKQKYGIVFIPQLYGNGNDTQLMKSFCVSEACFIIPDDNVKYDAYFQQYLISKLYAVIGMRYHSNIFSAKMGTPFISISYEQKMQGFMNKINLEKYCIAIDDLSFKILQDKFEVLCAEYDKYREKLLKEHMNMKRESYRSTEVLVDIVKRLNLA